MRNILIPTDFSENSKNAIRYALDYFSDIPVNFFMLHVSHKSRFVQDEIESLFFKPSHTPANFNPTVFLKEEIKYFQNLTKNPQHIFFPLQEDMLLVEAIRKQISEKEIDNIVMGTRGDSNQEEMGSHTYEVITKVKCPIMVIPESAKFDGIKNIAFITDYNAVYRNRVIKTLAEALHSHKSPLRVLHIRPQNSRLTSVQTDNKGFLHYSFKDTKHSFHFMENKNVESGIQDFVDTWGISLVAIIAKNLNFIQRLMLRPTSRVINYHTHIPFLVLHE